MYGPAGERRLTEFTLDWLGGYESSTPVRVGNAASEQFQLDVYGEVLATLYRTPRLSPTTGAPGLLGARARAARARSRTSGAGPTRASGRCGARASTSPTRR